MKVSRRSMIVAGVTAFVGLRYAYKWRYGDPEEVIVAILKRRVAYLRVDTKSFEPFAKAYVVARRQYRERLKHLSVAAGPLQYFTPYSWLRPGHPMRRLENNVVSMFLLSTDFFHNGADEGRVVSYVAFYDPMVAVCRNPFVNQRAG